MDKYYSRWPRSPSLSLPLSSVHPVAFRLPAHLGIRFAGRAFTQDYIRGGGVINRWKARQTRQCHAGSPLRLCKDTFTTMDSLGVRTGVSAACQSVPFGIYHRATCSSPASAPPSIRFSPAMSPGVQAGQNQYITDNCLLRHITSLRLQTPNS